MLKKLYSGNISSLRKSRLHDEKGNFVGINSIVLHAPLSIFWGITRLCGYRPILPWISYTSIGIFKNFLSKNSRVLEFGSGMSTIWYAKYAGYVCSVENNEIWYEKVKSIIEKHNLNNIHYQYCNNDKDYYSFMSQDNIGFDLIIVDGSYRSKCMASAIKLLKPGGIIYLDNSDKDYISGGDMRLAEDILLDFAQEKHAQFKYFTDFAPAEFFVNQGLMVICPHQ